MADLRGDKVDLLSARNLDLHGRRFTNSGNAAALQDIPNYSQVLRNHIYSLVISGALSVGTDLAPNIYIPSNGQVYFLNSRLKVASSGAPLVFNINVNGTLWLTVTIPDGDTFDEATQDELRLFIPLSAGSYFSIDVVSLGASASDLIVSIGVV